MANCLGTRIKELRILSGLSQEELGRRVGVQRAAINKYEKGTVTNIPLDTIEKIANIFDVLPTYLVGWDNRPINNLSMEVKIIQGIKTIYGEEVLEIIESYRQLSRIGQRRVENYVEDMWKIYCEDKQ